MKKTNFSFLTFFIVLSLLLAGCGSADDSNNRTENTNKNQNTEGTKETTDSIEIVSWEADREYYCYTLDDLLKHSDAVIVGKTVSEPEKDNSTDLKTSLIKVEVERVLEGSVEADEITLSRLYQFYDKDTVISLGELAPDALNDRWILFLVHDPERGEYGITSDGAGRYPLPENLDKPDGYGYKNGLLEPERFNYEICKQVYERYRLEE